MASFKSGLTPAERIVLAVDTADEAVAESLVRIAKTAGGRFVKFGLQIATAKSWQWCAELAQKHGLDWIADAKLADIPNTVKGSVASLIALKHRPYAITIHASAGQQAMDRAQKTAAGVKILAVTVLSSLSEAEVRKIYGASAKAKVSQLTETAAEAGLAGIVASPQEVKSIKNNPRTANLLTLIPGSRSAEAEAADQSRLATPAETIKAGADLLVIGREITQAEDPMAAYSKIVNDIEAVLNG